MTPGTRNGLIIAAIHLALIGSLGGKLLADRAMHPRVWVRAAPVDPNLPIRGRYVSLALEVDRFEKMDAARDAPAYLDGRPTLPVRLSVRDGQLVAEGSAGVTGSSGSMAHRGDHQVVRLAPVAFFIPESVTDPSVREPGEELWVEVSVPPRGAPRPIRLGVKKNGTLMPLELR